MESKRVFSWLTSPPKKNLTIRSFLYKFFVATSLELSKRTEVCELWPQNRRFCSWQVLFFWGSFSGMMLPPNPRQQNKALLTWNRLFGCLFTMELYHGIYHPITPPPWTRVEYFCGSLFPSRIDSKLQIQIFLGWWRRRSCWKKGWGGY